MNWNSPLPDETAILRVHRLLDKHKLAPQTLALVNEVLGAKALMLRAGMAVGATLIAPPEFDQECIGRTRSAGEAEQEGQPAARPGERSLG